MSSFHTFQIAPKSNKIVDLNDIKNLIKSLQEKKYIENSIKIYKGNREDILNITSWDFQGIYLESKCINENIELIDYADLKENENIIFQVFINKANDLLKDLYIFKLTELDNFPLFIKYFEKEINYEIQRIDIDTEDVDVIPISNINSYAFSSGRNLESLEGLGEKKDKYEDFFYSFDKLFDDFEIGTYYE